MNKKNKIIILVLCIIFLLLLAIFLIFYTNSTKEEFNPDDYEPIEDTKIFFLKDNLEVYEDVKLSDVVKLSNNSKIINDYKIDTKELGIIKLYLKYEENGKEKKNYTSIKVIDSTPPYVGIGESYSHIINTNFTFDSDILCADNFDKEIKCEIIGKYDLTKLGKNNVKVRAVDSSGNVTEQNFILNVIERPKQNSSTKTYQKLDDVLKAKPENSSVMIDVSKWQADIDWKKVKDSGVEYAMLRLGTQEAVDKGSRVDDYFEKNIKEAQKNGIKIGVYYYSYANDVEDARKQANWVIDKLSDYNLDLPVAFDWECWRYFHDFKISIHDLNEIAGTFLQLIEKAGYDTLNYGSKNYMENIWNLPNTKSWVAHYTDKTDYSKEYVMWQFTDSGLVPGIDGAVDLNYYYYK